MKQLLVLAIALTSVNAFATRARMLALGSSPQLVDTQTVYAKPADMFNLGSDYVTLESGATQVVGATPQTAQNSNSEGMIVRTMGDAKLGLSLGHQSLNASSWGLRAYATDAKLRVNQQNPLEFSYGMKSGDLVWAGTLVYSNFVDKTVAPVGIEKESSSGVRFGVSQGPWDGTLSLGLGNTANLLNGSKFTGTLGVGLTGGYHMETMYFFGNVVSAAAKQEDNAGTQEMKAATQTLSVGVVNSHKKDGSELFYSVALNQSNASSNTNSASTELKNSTLALPITIGMEVDAASWVTLRGSVSQSTLISNSKTEFVIPTVASASEFAPGANTTTVALGAGLKFNKLNVDGTLLTRTTGFTSTNNVIPTSNTSTYTSSAGQTLGTDTLLAQVGATYWF